MTVFVSPQPHERATWQADMRRAIAVLQAEAAARKAQEEHALVFDARQDIRDLKAQQRALAAGHTCAKCDRCGKEKVLSWAGGDCTEYDASTDDEMCPGTYRAAGGR